MDGALQFYGGEGETGFTDNPAYMEEAGAGFEPAGLWPDESTTCNILPPPTPTLFIPKKSIHPLVELSAVQLASYYFQV